MRISAEQERAVNELLRRRGETCPQCGEWRTLASTGVAYTTVNRRISIQYVCTNRGVDHPDPAGFGPWSLALEPHEARKAGLR